LPWPAGRRGNDAPGRSSTHCVPWLQAKLAAASGKPTIAEAIRYALSRWDGLIRFLDDGRIEIVIARSSKPAR
jgi:ABC-type amino acid transport substrate-binding protein